MERMKKLTLDLSEEKTSEKEIITQLNNIQPPKKKTIFIHDTTVPKWAKYWIKSI